MSAWLDPSPLVTVFNPSVMPFALFSQVTRFGLVGNANRKSHLSGKLKGDRKAFLQMIQSYGTEIEIVEGRPDPAGYSPE